MAESEPQAGAFNIVSPFATAQRTKASLADEAIEASAAGLQGFVRHRAADVTFYHGPKAR